MGKLQPNYLSTNYDYLSSFSIKNNPIKIYASKYHKGRITKTLALKKTTIKFIFNKVDYILKFIELSV